MGCVFEDRASRLLPVKDWSLYMREKSNQVPCACRASTDFEAKSEPRFENGSRDSFEGRRHTLPRAATKQMSFYEEPLSSSEDEGYSRQGEAFKHEAPLASIRVLSCTARGHSP